MLKVKFFNMGNEADEKIFVTNKKPTSSSRFFGFFTSTINDTQEYKYAQHAKL